MRSKNKMTRERNRTNTMQKTLKEEKVLYFAKDQQASSRILAVLSVGVSKQTFETKKKETYTKTLANGEKVTKHRSVPTGSFHKMKRFKIICGSNGKVGTWYNAYELVNNEVKSQKTVGRKITDTEFVEMYPNQCSAFKKVFADEYNKLLEAQNNGNKKK